MVRRVRIGPPSAKPARLPKMLTVKTSDDWGLDYELVVAYSGYSSAADEAIAKIAGLRRYDSGFAFGAGRRDLQFFGGQDKRVVYRAARRLWKADYFGFLTLEIRHPDEHEGKHTYTSWYCGVTGKLLRRVKHRELRKVIVIGRKHKRVRMRSTRRRRGRRTA
jgi:hypothetical protein